MYLKENNAHFINVMRTDGVYVKETLIQSESYDENTANHNSKAIAEIMKASPPKCTIYFPGGSYYFNGAPESGRATIESSGMMQSFVGDGINSTFIREKSREVETVFLMTHGRCAISDMSISSADIASGYTKSWEDNPHKNAITFDCYDAESLFTAECMAQNISINSSGNSLVPKEYYRPFEIAIKVCGNWLNTYFHTLWMMDIFTGFDVSETHRTGFLMGGPMKIIDVNYYATLDPNGDTGSKLHWSVFLKATGGIMEQIEIIHCTYIGSQFIYMDVAEGKEHKPCYNIVIDHSYVNTCKLDTGSVTDDETKSGIYMHLPTTSGAYARNPSDKGHYSRDIRFTNNTCMGRSTGCSAFFYVKGAVRGITVAGNDFSSGGSDKCVYIRSTDVKTGSDTGVHDVKVTGNYFRNYKTPITIGHDGYDPSRNNTDKPDRDYYIDRVIVSNNQTMNEKAVEKIGMTGIYLSKCRSISVMGNTFCPTLGHGVALNVCKKGALTGNVFEGFVKDEHGKSGIWLNKCMNIAVGMNTICGFRNAVEETGSENVTIAPNIIVEVDDKDH